MKAANAFLCVFFFCALHVCAAWPRYRAIGRAMVKCLLEGRRIGSRLAPSVFKFITGTDSTLRDLQASVLAASGGCPGHVTC